MQQSGKIIVLSAPSGSGKSSIIQELRKDASLRLGFSISCTSRHPRGQEKDGVDYYFVAPEVFKARVDAGEFVEWEEVYAGTCYGTLKSEVERVVEKGDNLIMDIDVKGALNIKKIYGHRAVTIFIQPPSINELEKRLRNRATDDEKSILCRLGKAREELKYAESFDYIVVNDDLQTAVKRIATLIAE